MNLAKAACLPSSSSMALYSGSSCMYGTAFISFRGVSVVNHERLCHALTSSYDRLASCNSGTFLRA